MIRLECCTPALRRFLERHRIETLNIAGILENEPRVEIFVDDEEEPRGVLVKGPWFRYVHTEDDALLEELFQEMEGQAGFYPFSGVWRPIAEKIKARFNLVWDAPCDLYHLPPERHIPPLAASRAVSVELKDAEVIDAHYAYKNDHSLEKIRRCIQYRPSSAIYVDGTIACWLLVHEDNSLGIMYTMEEHRRKGLAVDVSLDLVDKQLKAGKTPFLQIRTNNDMSPSLATKCGFVQHGSCDWFGVVAGVPQELIDGGAAFRNRALEAGWPVPAEACLYRFLYALPPGEPETNPVVEIPEEEWLRFGSNGVLRPAVERLRGSLRLLGERGPGGLQATAALLVDDEDGFELLGCADADSAFLERVVLRAKALKLGTVIIHTAAAERPKLEACGFRSAMASA